MILRTLLLCFICLASSRPARCGSEPARRNILFLSIDDLRPSLGCMGDAVACTPHIDSLAARGLVFERHYSQQALCNPARSSLLTGRRPRSLRVTDLADNYRLKNPAVVTLPQLLRACGYTTLAMGKVHHTRDLDDPLSWSEPPFWPPDARYQAEASREALEERGRWLEEQGHDLHHPRGPAYESSAAPGDVYVDGLIASEAVRRLEELAHAPEPFFLAVGFKKPHLPFVAPADCWARYDRASFAAPERGELPRGTPDYAGIGVGELRAYVGIPHEGELDPELARTMRHAYYACVSHVDDQVGRVLDALDALGLSESTAVVLWSDHGFQLGELGQWCKHTNFETALRSPLIVAVPDSFGIGQVRGRSTLALVETVDLYPTLALLCGILPPADLEGASFLPLLEDPERPWKEAVFSEYPRYFPHIQRSGIGVSVRTAEHRFTLWRVGRDTVGSELYEYGPTLLEFENHAADEEWKGVLSRMRARLGRGWEHARAALHEGGTARGDGTEPR